MTKIKEAIIQFIGDSVLLAIDLIIYVVRTLTKLVGLLDRKN